MSPAPRAMCVGLVAAGYRLDQPVVVAVLAVLAIAAEHESIRLHPDGSSIASLSSSSPPSFWGPWRPSFAQRRLADLPRRDGAQPVLRWVTWTAIRVIVAGAAGLTRQP